MEQKDLIEEYLMPEEWIKVADKILKDKGIILVIGATDTGKSICTLLFANFWSEHGIKVGIIDVDTGQSDLGPPTTMGMVTIDKPVKNLQDSLIDTLYFVGSTSPLNHFLTTICGTKKLIDEGKKKSAEIIIVDTTGLVSGSLGRTLKENMIGIISPCHIIALQREDELEHIFKNINLIDGATIHRLLPCTQVKRRNSFQRREAREEKFREFFKKASPLEIKLDNLNIKGSYYCSGVALKDRDLSFIEKILMTEVIYVEKTSEGLFVITKEKFSGRYNGFFQIKRRYNAKKIMITEEANFKNLLVSFDNKQGFAVSLGIVQETNFKRKYFIIHTPLKDLSQVFGLKFGCIKIDLDGKEIAKIFPGEI